jgi:hypothetical protein
MRAAAVELDRDDCGVGHIRGRIDARVSRDSARWPRRNAEIPIAGMQRTAPVIMEYSDSSWRRARFRDLEMDHIVPVAREGFR